MPQQLSAIVGCAAEGLDFYPHVERVAHRLGYDVRASQACEDLWDDRCARLPFCAILEARLMFASRAAGTKFCEVPLPCIAIVPRGDVPAAVRAIQIGAANVLEAPLDEGELFSNLQSARQLYRCVNRRLGELRRRRRCLDSLTSREQAILDFLMEGRRNKEIAGLLSISLRTVEAERARIMKKMGVDSLASLVEVVWQTRNQIIENPWQMLGKSLSSDTDTVHDVDISEN